MSAGNSTEGDDDLEVTESVKRSLAKEAHVDDLTEHEDQTQGFETQDGETKALDDSQSQQRSRGIPAGGERILWSDENSDKPHEKAKKRKSLKRKREAASTKKANVRANGKQKKSKQLDNGDNRPAHVGEDLSESDGGTLDVLPDYLQARKARFEKRTKAFKEAGLKLPPNFDEVEFSDDERLACLQERPRFPKAKPIGPYKDRELPYSLGLIPAPIAQWLREYQVQGVAFLHKLFVYQTGGILGDDMGLGKTVQVIAFLTAAFGKTGDERDSKRMRKMRRVGAKWYPRVLVVCPGSLIENWRAEFQRWGWWHVDVYHGTSKEAALEQAAAGRLEIMITTYSTYRNSKSAINCVEWDCVVADEFHQIKGRKSETTQAMNEVNALCRIGLTGTAIQNDYQELWTLLNWTNPGRFGPLATWRSTISDPLKVGQSHDATMHQLGRARKTAKALVENLLPQFFLRRMKTLIADQLPKKSDRVVFCPLTTTQADAYQRLLDSDILQYIRTSSDPCPCGSTKKAGWCCQVEVPGGGKWQSYVFPAIMNLQKLSNHIAVLIPQGTDPKEKQDKDLAMLQSAVPEHWRDLYRSRDSILNYSNSEFCGKWKVLKKLLKFWHDNGDKALIFSHSLRLLKMLRMLFQNTAYNVSYLDGSMSYEDRARAVDDFNSDPDQFVFLISTKAGGVGLNITSANKVVIMDPNWNPSHDLQAQDRAYRIGQSRDVEVFRLVSSGTIEEIVYARQIYKQQQANIGYTASHERRYFKGVQSSTHKKGEIFGLANLFSYAGEQVVLRDIVNKTNVAESRAGVAVVDVDLADLDDDENASGDPLLVSDDEDGAMSQLAAFVASGGSQDLQADSASASTGGKPRPSRKRKVAAAGKSDPVQAILAGAGVEYTHENSEVIGSSRVEAHLSRRAAEAGDDVDLGERQVFRDTQDLLHDPIVRDSSRLPRGGRAARGGLAFEGEDGGDGGGSTVERPVWAYRPPADVARRQFCTMARTFGFESAAEFALVVEGWTQAQRRSCLDKFYRIRREKLGLGARWVEAEEDG